MCNMNIISLHTPKINTEHFGTKQNLLFGEFVRQKFTEVELYLLQNRSSRQASIKMNVSSLVNFCFQKAGAVPRLWEALNFQNVNIL